MSSTAYFNGCVYSMVTSDWVGGFPLLQTIDKRPSSCSDERFLYLSPISVDRKYAKLSRHCTLLICWRDILSFLPFLSD